MEKRTAHEKADLVVIWVVSGPGRRLDDWLTDKRGEGALLGGRGVAHLGGCKILFASVLQYPCAL